MNGPDTSPRDREIERFIVGLPTPCSDGEWVRFSDLQAREAELEKERDLAKKRERIQRDRADSAWKRTGELLRERRDRMDGFMREEASADLEQLEAAAKELGHHAQRAEKAEALVTEARAEMEREADEDEALIEGIAGRKAQIRAAIWRRAAALLTATPCSDQGEDPYEDRTLEERELDEQRRYDCPEEEER